MATDNDQLRAPSSESLEAGYETSTVSIKGLAWFVIGLILTAAVVHAAMWFLLMGYVNYDEKKDQPFSALTDQRFIADYNKQHGTALKVSRIPLPPVPLIQPSKPEHNLPADDLRNMFDGEDKLFRQMGWEIDPQTHVQLRIPPPVITAVVRQESQRQQQEKQTK